MAPPLTVKEALHRIVDGVSPVPTETVPIAASRGRTLAAALAARVTQPPFDASAMDGYAVRKTDVQRLPATLTLIGEAAAGHPFAGTVTPGQAVRILTGAALPAGADAIVIQENTERDGSRLIVREGSLDKDNIRTRGFDFGAGEILLEAGRRLGPRELSLAAAMGHGMISVRRHPRIAVLATGDELVAPGTPLGPGQITCSNDLGVGALAEAAGAEVQLLGIAGDTETSLREHIARAEGCDVLVTIGGASVGDHDLVAPVLQRRGMALDFWKIAMRPGKPLLFGRLENCYVVGLPGNPVSALVCSRLFLVPLVRALLGQRVVDEAPVPARCITALERNGPREHYMRATFEPGPDGMRLVRPVRSQDSSLLSPLAAADCLLIRPPSAPAEAAGTIVPTLPLDL